MFSQYELLTEVFPERAQAEGLPSLPSEEVRDSSALNRDKHKRRYWRKMVTIIKGVIVGELDSEVSHCSYHIFLDSTAIHFFLVCPHSFQFPARTPDDL